MFNQWFPIHKNPDAPSFAEVLIADVEAMSPIDSWTKVRPKCSPPALRQAISFALLFNGN